VLTEPGVYTFSKMTVKDGATVGFEKNVESANQPVTIGSDESKPYVNILAMSFKVNSFAGTAESCLWLNCVFVFS